MYLFFLYLFVIAFVNASGSYVPMKGNFLTADGKAVSDIFIAIHVTKCTKDVLIKYQPLNSQEFVHAFLSKYLKIVPSSSIINCPTELSYFVDNSIFSIKRVSVYVIVDIKPPSVTHSFTTTKKNAITSTTTMTTRQTPSNHFWTVNPDSFFDSINDYLESLIAAAVASLVFFLRPLIFNAIRLFAKTALRKFVGSQEQQGEDIEQQTTTSSLYGNTNVLVVRETRPISPRIRLQQVTAASASSHQVIPSTSSPHQATAAAASSQQIIPSTSSPHQATAAAASSQQAMRSTSSSHQATAAAASSQQTDDSIYCKCTVGPCITCRCALNNKKCTEKCHNKHVNPCCKNL